MKEEGEKKSFIERGQKKDVDPWSASIHQTRS